MLLAWATTGQQKSLRCCVQRLLCWVGPWDGCYAHSAPLAVLLWPVTPVWGLLAVVHAAEHPAEERNCTSISFIVGRWPV